MRGQPKDTVLEAYPEAVAVEFVRRGWFILDPLRLEKPLGQGATERAAWYWAEKNLGNWSNQR